MNEGKNTVEKPSQVVQATVILWVSLGIRIVTSLLNWETRMFIASTGVGFFFFVGTFTLMALIIYNISMGRNWARITFLVLLVSGAALYFPSLIIMFGHSPLIGSLSVLATIFEFVALFLIFATSGAEWFRRRS